MGVTVDNDYLLLEKEMDSSAQFSIEGNDGNKYKVAVGQGDFRQGMIVYVRDTEGKIKVCGEEFELARLDEVVAHVA